MQAVGFILFLFGCAGMDNTDMVVPAVMVLVGLIILKLAAVREGTECRNKTARIQGQIKKQKKADKSVA